MVSPDHDDLEMRQPVSGVRYESIEPLLGRDGRVRHVIQITRDKQDVTELFFSCIQQPGEESIVFCLTGMARKFVTEMPVGCVEDFDRFQRLFLPELLRT